MARAPRIDVADYAYHVINRSNGKAQIFHNDSDYSDFEYLMSEMIETYDVSLLAYVVMPNHWHMLLLPKKDGEMGKALHWLTTSHVRRHHARHKTIGHGHLYQGTYKSFLVETDPHFLTVLKYIERNAVRAKLSSSAESWRWGSAYRRLNGNGASRRILAEPPVPLPRNYHSWINDPEPSETLSEVRHSVSTSATFGVVDVRGKNNIMQ